MKSVGVVDEETQEEEGCRNEETLHNLNRPLIMTRITGHKSAACLDEESSFL